MLMNLLTMQGDPIKMTHMKTYMKMHLISLNCVIKYEYRRTYLKNKKGYSSVKI